MCGITGILNRPFGNGKPGNPRKPGSGTSPPLQPSSTCGLWRIEASSSRAAACINPVCGFPRRRAALRAAGLHPLRWPGSALSLTCQGPPADPHPKGLRPNPSACGLQAKGLRPRECPIQSQPRLAVSRTGSAARRHVVEQPVPSHEMVFGLKGLRPGKAGGIVPWNAKSSDRQHAARAARRNSPSSSSGTNS